MTDERAREWLRDGLAVKSRSVPSRKKHITESKELKPVSVGNDIRVLKSQARERTGSPTQKSQSLAERTVTASTNPSDLVLDNFAGCA